MYIYRYIVLAIRYKQYTVHKHVNCTVCLLVKIYPKSLIVILTIWYTIYMYVNSLFALFTLLSCTVQCTCKHAGGVFIVSFLLFCEVNL